MRARFGGGQALVHAMLASASCHYDAASFMDDVALRWYYVGSHWLHSFALMALDVVYFFLPCVGSYIKLTRVTLGLSSRISVVTHVWPIGPANSFDSKPKVFRLVLSLLF